MGWILLELQVMNSPFNQEQVDLLNRLLPTLNTTQRIWLSGYIAALPETAAGPTTASAVATPVETSPTTTETVSFSKDVTILFGSQTGNSNGLAKKMSKKLEEQGFQITLSSMGDFKPNQLKKVENLLIVVSTQGEGDPPDNAIPFFEFVHSKRAPQLEHARFAVLGLGDTSYEFFCQTGKDFDKRLAELGAERLVPRVDCDVDFEEPATAWMNDVLAALTQSATASASSATTDQPAVSSTVESEYTRTNPFQAEVLKNLNLNGRGSSRETRHIELSLEGSHLEYQPGDSLGVYPQNHPQLVNDIISAMRWNSDDIVTISKHGDQASLHEALLHHYEITTVTKPIVQQLAELSSSDELKALVAPGREQDLRAYISGIDLLDLIQDHSFAGVSAQEFTSVLRKIPARLYSIASSPQAFPEEVHVTVRAVRYEARGRERYGVCSVHLAERLEAGDTLPVYIQHNDNFRLPENPETPIIMIGPGTGVAPFRAFVGEREETGASGKSWLFYGDQHFATDFLYQTEWQRWLKDGALTRMDVAFSRDTADKVYVQHRMLERSKELFEWLQEGAAIYVCGDEKQMANDVHLTLEQIIAQEGQLSPEEATEYLTRMQQEKRYQRDVY